MSKLDKKIISIAIIAIMMVMNLMPVVSYAATTDDIIKDPILKKEFFDENKDGKISKDEVENCHWLTIEEGVKDLSGLEYLTKLYEISYYYDGTTIDFSPVVKENITFFNIHVKPGITKVNFDFLKDFSNVEFLNIYAENKAKIDLSGIEEYSNIKDLCINNIEVENLNNISKLTNLEYLSVDNFEQEIFTIDLTGIEKLTKLTGIYFDNVNIKNVNTIGKLINLENLQLRNCKRICRC